MKILFLSEEGDGLGVAHRLAKEGNDVLMYVRNTQYKKAGEGMLNRVHSWRPYFQSVDLIICDMVGFGKHEEILRKTSAPIFGLSKFFDIIELDREKGFDLFKRAGIKSPETFVFKTPKEAQVILDTWEDPGYVIKPSGNISTAATSLHRYKETFEHALSLLDASQPLIIQKIVEGVEISTEGWFNGRHWITPFNHTFEEKRFMVGNIGPNTGCMGNVVIAAHKKNRLIQETLEKLTPILRKDNYRGPIDINCIVNEKGAFGLELTTRLGYDAIEALLEGTQERATDVLFETAAGVKENIKVSRNYMIAVRLSTPPWPHAKPDDGDDKVGMPILGINDKNEKHIWLTDVYEEDGKYLYAGGDGVVCKVTAEGRDLREARNRVYRTVKNIVFSDKQYREDIGDRVEGDLSKLKEWGWL